MPESEDYELGRISLSDDTMVVVQFGTAQTSDGQILSDWRIRPSVVFTYGNRMSIAGSQGIFNDLRRMGLNVVVPEYPGYGMNVGKTSEEGCYSAAEAAYEYLVVRKKLSSESVCSVGLSLGASVAAELATRKKISAVVMVVPFTRTRDVGHDHLAWYLRWAVPMLTRDVSFDNLSKVARINVPVLLVEAARDQVTSSDRSAELARAVLGPLTRVRVEADHDSAWVSAVPQIKAWLNRTLGPSASTVANEMLNPTATADADRPAARSAPAVGEAHL